MFSCIEQMPPSYAPWQRSTELCEAYDRFLERMEKGTLCEDDGGWADKVSRSALYSVDGLGRGDITEDSGVYDSNLGFVTDDEIEEHYRKEKAKEQRRETVDLQAQKFIREDKKRKEAKHLAWLSVRAERDSRRPAKLLRIEARKKLQEELVEKIREHPRTTRELMDLFELKCSRIHEMLFRPRYKDLTVYLDGNGYWRPLKKNP